MVRSVQEVDSVEQFDRLLAAGPTSAGRWRLQDLDLRPYADALAAYLARRQRLF